MMEALTDTAAYRQRLPHHVGQRRNERGENEVGGNQDDPQFIRFVKVLRELRSRRTRNEPEDTTDRTLDENFEEAERHFLATRGDPAEEADRPDEARRHRKTTQQTTDDQ